MQPGDEHFAKARKASTVGEYRATLESHVRPAFGPRPMDA